MALSNMVASAADAELTFPKIAVPTIPGRTFTIVDYGAVGDGNALNTAAFSKTVAAAEQVGGGVVDVPQGKYVTGPFSLASDIDLHLEAGATILISDDIANYPLRDGDCVDCITANRCHDVEITGSGTIDGQGQAWWSKYAHGGDQLPHRPFMVVFTKCRRVLVENVTLQNSPMFHLVPDDCSDVTIRNVRIFAPDGSPNTDGCDPSGCNIAISGCTIDVGDDNIAVKPGRVQADDGVSCENISISNCTFLHGHGVSIGGQTPGGLRNMLVKDCTFDNTAFGIRMKASRGAGGLVENVEYDNLTMRNVHNTILIYSYYESFPKDVGKDPAQPVNNLTPIWRNIRVNNVTSANSEIAGQIIGLPEMPVSDITLTNVNIAAAKGMWFVYAKNIRFVNSQVTTPKGNAVTSTAAEVSGIDPVSGSPI
jgi:polygalacturonase